MKNTKHRGSLTFFIFKEKKTDDFIGVCLELAIVKEGTRLDVVRRHLEEAAKGYVTAVCKNNLSDDLLNQKPPQAVTKILEGFLRSVDSKTRDQSTRVRRPALESAVLSTRQVADLCYA